MEYRDMLVSRGGRGADYIDMDVAERREFALNVVDVRNAITKEELERGITKFEQYDLDRSGAIDYWEFLAVLQKKDHPALRGLFNMFDRDGNKTIDLQEFTIGLKEFSALKL